MEQFDHKKIEKKWQKVWQTKKINEVKDTVKGKKNEYLLVEFPYPSGNLHVGHWYAFAMPDIYARYRRATGKNVMYPIGFDAFGLPAENAAIKNGINPRKWTYGNMKTMKTQLASMGASFDWSREVVTCDPEYYRWTQWQFLQFYKNGLAYQKETAANWCPKDMTVLANEQVVGGKCERCGTEVEQRQMLQWNLKITDYADRLIDDLAPLNWPEQIKESQRNWIGRSEGAEISFQIKDQLDMVTVFTTRADTLFGATYLVLAPESELVQKLQNQITNQKEVNEYIKKTNKKTALERQENKEKTGVCLEGVTAINPASLEEIPVYIADYVLGNYGTGAIMAVPAHDERDFAFAQKFNLPVVDVISAESVLTNSKEFSGIASGKARELFTQKFGKSKTTYKLRDWGVSRQRYWGVPIPIIHCNDCGAVAVPDKDLPVKLPEIKDYLPTGDGKSPLAKVAKWVNVKCPRCKGKALRETDTFDTFVDSSWYFLRYTDPKNKKQFADKKKQENWMPIDMYAGGPEHTTMHLLYSRFWHKALYDLKLVKDKEPYARRMNRGLIMGPDGQKMSKSKGNVVDPDSVVRQFGADTVRLYLAFIGPYNEPGSYPWNPDSIVGVRRFLERVWRMSDSISNAKPDKEVERQLHLTIAKVQESCIEMKFNTGISAMMIFLNAAEKSTLTPSQFGTFLQLLAPFAPHITEELWSELGHKTSIHLEKWPKFDPKKIKTDTVKIMISINGKVKGEMDVASDARNDEIEKTAQEAIKNYLVDKTITRVIVVPNRMVNFVVE